MKALIITILALCFTLSGTASAEEPKMKASGPAITVKTELGVGRFATILEAFKEEGIEIDKRNHPNPPVEVEITYLTYSNAGDADKATPAQIEADLKANGFRSATIEELASVDPGNSGLANGQKVVAFGTEMILTPTESLMFSVTVKDKTGMDIIRTSPNTGWIKKGLLIPAVKLKTPGGKVTV